MIIDFIEPIGGEGDFLILDLVRIDVFLVAAVESGMSLEFQL